MQRFISSVGCNSLVGQVRLQVRLNTPRGLVEFLLAALPRDYFVWDSERRWLKTGRYKFPTEPDRVKTDKQQLHITCMKYHSAVHTWLAQDLQQCSPKGVLLIRAHSLVCSSAIIFSAATLAICFA